jgi:hypothetical protein
MAKILHTLSDKWATEKVTSGVISGTQIERWNMTGVQSSLVHEICCLRAVICLISGFNLKHILMVLFSS